MQGLLWKQAIFLAEDAIKKYPVKKTHLRHMMKELSQSQGNTEVWRTGEHSKSFSALSLQHSALPGGYQGKVQSTNGILSKPFS